MPITKRLVLAAIVLGLAGSSGRAEGPTAPPMTTEKAQVAAILADKEPGGSNPRFVAAVRHIAELGGVLDFDAAGHLVGVDLAGDRVSLSDADVPCLTALPHLKQLKLSGAGVTNASIRQVASLAGLGELSLLDAQIDDAGLRQLARLSGLGALSIRRSSQVTDRGLACLRQLPKLTKLGLLEVGITDRGLEELGGLAQLRLLDLRGNAQVGNRGLERLEPLKQLQALRLGGYQVNDDTLAVLVKMRLPSLTSLTIDEAAVTDAGLARIAVLPLEDLSISRCYSITDDGFRAFADMAGLRQLSVRGIPLTGAGLARLGAKDKLAVLRLNETGINDAALEHLRGLKNLARLELRQTQISDAAVDLLGGLKRLKVLDVGQTEISDAGAKRLAELLPRCRITR
jgi:Leucine-rich repeat (LRR) protein